MKILRILSVFASFLLPGVVLAQAGLPAGPPSVDDSSQEVLSAAQEPTPEPPPPPPDPMELRGPMPPPGALAVSRPGRPHGMRLGAWWKNSEIVSKLQLSEEQVRKIEDTYLNHRLKLIDLRANLEKQEVQLEPLLDADRPDEGKVATQIDEITAARGRLEKENALMMLAIRRVLTVDQWKKLQTLDETHRTGGPVVLERRWRAHPPAGPASTPGPPEP